MRNKEQTLDERGPLPLATNKIFVHAASLHC